VTLRKPSGDLPNYRFKHWKGYCLKHRTIISMSEEVIMRVEQLANGQQEATTPDDDDDEPIRIDINVGNDGEAHSVADYRSDTEGYDPDTQDEIVDNNNDLSSASSLEFTRNESELNGDEEELTLELGHHDTIDPTNNNHDIITDHDNN
jgi:hypothetical protein